MSRYLFLPLPYDNRNLAINNEMMVDYIVGDVYINTSYNNIQLGFNRVELLNNESINNIIGEVDIQNINLRTIGLMLDKILTWRDIMNSKDLTGNINSIAEIYDKLIGITTTDNLNDIFAKKQTKEPFMQLSDNDFTDELFTKLDTAVMYANKYVHPAEKQCIYYPMISSVNNKKGHVVLTKAELGIDKIDPLANNYVHPDGKMCTHPVVVSVNSKVGKVTINKRDIGLSNIENYPVSTKSEAIHGSSNTYLTNSNIKNILDQYTFTYMLNCKLGLDGSLFGVLLSDVDTDVYGSIPTLIKGDTKVKFPNMLEYSINTCNEIISITTGLQLQVLEYENDIIKDDKYKFSETFSTIITPTGISPVKALGICYFEGSDLYVLGNDTYKKIATNVANASIHDNNIIYITKNDNIYTTKYDGSTNHTKLSGVLGCIKALGNNTIKAYLSYTGELKVNGVSYYNIQDISINNNCLVILSRTGEVTAYPEKYNTLIREKISTTRAISIDAKGEYILILTDNNIPIIIVEGGII